MGSSSAIPPGSGRRPPEGSAGFTAAFRAAAGPSGAATFATFVETALYDPRMGYYRRPKPRIGRTPEADFFTASSLGPIFGELVAEACVSLLRGLDPESFTFVEIGAEPGGPGVGAAAARRFGGARTVRLGDPLDFSGPCVVFSNEVLDAQPFSRFVFRRGAWRELGVALGDGGLREVELPSPVPAFLPRTAPEGYLIDAPLGACRLLDKIADRPWTGLFAAIDYGRSWREIAEGAPAGTARAYQNHVLSADLLADPGERDLTCDVCWDWLEEALVRRGFSNPVLESQESFFVRHAGAAVSSAIEAAAGKFDARKRSILQLIHPSHMGFRFQVLHASRWAAPELPLPPPGPDR
jgi:SAM-dependent MidA family methyltransferase